MARMDSSKLDRWTEDTQDFFGSVDRGTDDFLWQQAQMARLFKEIQADVALQVLSGSDTIVNNYNISSFVNYPEIFNYLRGLFGSARSVSVEQVVNNEEFNLYFVQRYGSDSKEVSDLAAIKRNIDRGNFTEKEEEDVSSTDAAADLEAEQQAALEEQMRLEEQEAARVAAEQEAERIAAEQEAARVAAEEAAKAAAEEEAARVAEEERLAAEAGAEDLQDDEDLLQGDFFVQVEEGAEDGDPFFEPPVDYPEIDDTVEVDDVGYEITEPEVTFEDPTEEAGGGGATDATDAADTGEAADAADATDVATEATDVATEATQTDITSTTDEAGDGGMLTTGGESTEAGRPAEIGDKITDGRGTIWIYTGRSPINPNVGIWVAENPDDILIEEYELQTGRVWDEETQIGAVVGTGQDASTVISEATQDIPEPGQTEEPTSAEEEKEEGVALRDILDVFLETGTEDTTAPTEVVTTVPTEEVTTAPTEVVTTVPTEVVTTVPTEVVTTVPTEEVTTDTGQVATGTGDTTTAVTTVGTGEGTGVSDTGTGEGGDAGTGAGDAGDTTTVGTGAGTEGTGDEGDGVEGVGTDGTGEGTGGDGTGDGTGGAAPISTGGMFSPKPFQGYMGGLSYQIPEFRGVYYQPRDYDVELNRIIQQSLFQGMY